MQLTSYQERRTRLINELGEAMAIIPAATHKTRSHDTEYPFRQNSHYKYLTGLNEANACLVLCPNHPEWNTVLFVLDKNPDMEMWMGKRLGVEKAKFITEVDQCFSIDQFDEVLPDILAHHHTVTLDLADIAQIERVQKAMKRIPKALRKKELGPRRFESLDPIIGRLRLHKDQNEIQFMKKAAHLSDRAHRAAMAFCSPGKK
jgi:Xaa-Pro aminopeptidase